MVTQTSHSKINHIEVNGNNNIVIQDVSGNSKIYINSDAGAKELYEDFKQEIFEIRLLLKQRQELVLQQFAEKIYNIANIENASFYGEGRITIEKAGKISFDRRSLTETQKDRLEMLEGLERRFQKRLNEKMKTELRFQLELNLQYTKEGTNETYLKDYYIDSYEEKSADSFERLFRDYERTLKRLLILGEAGSGKTVLMLQFGLKLVELAKQNFDYPTPILLNLATWRDENQSFENWLEENLVYAAGEYGTARKYAKEMVQENNLLLLLDGLDEIPENDRKACLDKLRGFLDKLDNSRPADRNFPTVIISSRKQEYLTLGEQAPVRANISLADLTAESVCKELERIKASQDTKAKILLNRIAEMPEIAPKLKSAFEVHLSLTMANTFDFSQLSTQNLVNAYLDQEIKELETKCNYPKTRHYLSFLATKMKENKKGLVFELVDMQPSWAKFRILYKFLYRFVFANAIFFILTLSGLLVLDAEVPVPKKILIFEDYPVIITAIFLISSFFSFFVFFIKFFTEEKIQKNDIHKIDIKNFKNNSKATIISILQISLFIILFSLIIHLHPLMKQKINFEEFIFRIIASLKESLIISVIINFPYFFYKEKLNPIIQHSYGRFKMGLLFIIETYLFSVSLFITFLSILGFVNAIKDIIPMIIFFTFLAMPLYIYRQPIFRHFILRFCLFLEKKIPLRLRTFLNKVSQTGIMEKDGGQWRFRHQLLMEALISKRGE